MPPGGGVVGATVRCGARTLEWDQTFMAEKKQKAKTAAKTKKAVKKTSSSTSRSTSRSAARKTASPRSSSAARTTAKKKATTAASKASAKPAAEKSTKKKAVKASAKTVKTKTGAKAAASAASTKSAAKAKPAATKKISVKEAMKAAQAKLASQSAKKTKAKSTASAATATAKPSAKAGAKRAAASAPAPSSVAAKKPAPAATAKNKKPAGQRHGFKINEQIVYPAHGVGKIIGIEEQEIAGMALELFVINFDKEKLTLRVPTGKLESVGMRKLADEALVKKAMGVLKGRARIKRTMWSRRAQEYIAKINSGDIISIAEVVRDLYRSETQPEQSYSERQLYEDALDRMAREVAAVEKLDERGAVQRITDVLSKSARGRRLAEEEADAAEAAAEAAA